MKLWQIIRMAILVALVGIVPAFFAAAANAYFADFAGSFVAAKSKPSNFTLLLPIAVAAPVTGDEPSAVPR